MKIKSPFSTAVAIGSGLIVLLTYLINVDEINNVRKTLLGWVVIASAAALLVGLINLITVHINKIRQGKKPLYSFVLVTSAIITFSLTLALGPGHFIPQGIFQYIQIPVESSLMAVLAVTLTYASTRLLSHRPNLYSVVFLLTLIVTLLGTAPFFNIEIPFISELIRPFLSKVLAGAGARGLLIGVGLGTVATGIRILIGADRPFSR